MTAPTPLDLDAIRQRATQGYPFLGLWAACNDALVLIAENERLRTICAGPPRHIAAEDPEGLATSTLTARPAPAWDEEAVVEGMVRAMYPLLFADDRHPPRGQVRSDAELREGERDVARERMRQALAVVRDHLPVKPDREGALKRAYRDRQSPIQEEDAWAFGEGVRAGIDAVLAEWPGESRATVQAEALRDVVEKYAVTIPDALGYKVPAVMTEDLLARADRLAAEGGADRG